MPAKPGPKSDKFWSEAIRMAVMREDEIDGKKVKRLRIVADKIVELAMNGDIAAMKEIGDRLDGKPAQAHTGADRDEVWRAVAVHIKRVSDSTPLH